MIGQDLTQEEKHIQDIRNIFTDTDFKSVETERKIINFKGKRGEIDDVFLYKNIIVLAEYTCAASKKISPHLYSKKFFLTIYISIRVNLLSF